MPSVSGKQHRFMAAVASNPKIAKKAGVPQSVGEEFLKADTGRKFARGGEMAESKKMVGKEIAFMKKAGAPKSMVKHEKAEMGMKKGGDVKKEGAEVTSGDGTPVTTSDGSPLRSPYFGGDGGKKGGAVKHGSIKKMAGGGLAAGHKSADGIAQRGKTRGMEVKMAAGGLAAGHKQADGIARKGKTKGMQVKMAGGGYKGC